MTRIKKSLCGLRNIMQLYRNRNRITLHSTLVQKKVIVRRKTTLNKLYRHAIWENNDHEHYDTLQHAYSAANSALKSKKIICLTPNNRIKVETLNIILPHSGIILSFIIMLAILLISTFNAIHDANHAKSILKKIKTQLLVDKLSSLNSSNILSELILNYDHSIKPRISNQLFAYKKIRESTELLSKTYIDYQIIPLLRPKIESELKKNNTWQYNALLSALSLDPNSTLDFYHYRGNVAKSLNDKVDANSLVLLSSASNHHTLPFKNRLIEQAILSLNKSTQQANDILNAISARYLSIDNNIDGFYTLKGYQYFRRTLSHQASLYQLLIGKMANTDSITMLYEQKLTQYWRNQLSHGSQDAQSSIKTLKKFLNTRYVPFTQYHEVFNMNLLFLYQHAPQLLDYFHQINRAIQSPCSSSEAYLSETENPIYKLDRLSQGAPILAKSFIRSSAAKSWQSLNQACINTRLEDWIALETLGKLIFNRASHAISFKALKLWTKNAGIYFKKLPLLPQARLSFILPPLQARRYEQFKRLKASHFDKAESTLSIYRIHASSNIKSINISTDQQTFSYHYGPFNTITLKLHPKTLSLNIILFNGETISKTYQGATSWLQLTRHGKLINDHRQCLWLYHGITLYISPKIICRVFDPNFWH